MDAVEFLRARRKLCNDNVCEESCPLFHCCDDDIEDDRIRQVFAVEQWVKEHPVKTRQSEFLKMFPNASVGYNGTLVICPSQADTKAVAECVRSERNCDKCKRDFWLKEIG